MHDSQRSMSKLLTCENVRRTMRIWWDAMALDGVQGYRDHVAEVHSPCLCCCRCMLLDKAKSYVSGLNPCALVTPKKLVLPC